MLAIRDDFFIRSQTVEQKSKNLDLMPDRTTKIDLRNLTYEQMENFFSGLGLTSGRARQVFSWLSRPELRSFAQMINIKKEVRDLLNTHARISFLQADAIEQSSDGTVKFGFRLDDGLMIESVLIPSENRYTLCVSSQVGCAMGCVFCLTAKMGFVRNLTAGEIVGQVMAVLSYMANQGIERCTTREYINNLVFMGMGEPLANYDNLIAALTILMDARGLEFTERRVTVSTCGLTPKIAVLGRDVRVNLAISLHAADNQTRDLLMPVNKTYPLEGLLQACREFPLGRKKVILIEYILMKGVNDRIQDAEKLGRLLQGIPCRINLLSLNESSELAYACSDREAIDRFRQVLHDHGLLSLLRDSRGADISAACGQLASSAQKANS
jgi:23S rRNA (adenine2503-C2)-methyltransferase